jgi:hypothetical protein
LFVFLICSLALSLFIVEQTRRTGTTDCYGATETDWNLVSVGERASQCRGIQATIQTAAAATTTTSNSNQQNQKDVDKRTKEEKVKESNQQQESYIGVFFFFSTTVFESSQSQQQQSRSRQQQHKVARQSGFQSHRSGTHGVGACRSVSQYGRIWYLLRYPSLDTILLRFLAD